MSIRKVERGVSGSVSGTRTGRTSGIAADAFSSLLQSVSQTENVRETQALDTIAPVEGRQGRGRSEESMRQAEEVLEELATLQEVIEETDGPIPSERLLEARDQALRTLSNTPPGSGERDLLHRTAVLATVELAKNDRGDYQ